jgi:hypothetical protein
MEDDVTAIPQPMGSGPLSRRDALKRGAVIAGAAFVIPVVQTIVIKPTAAQAMSGRGGTQNNQNNQDDNSQGGKGANDQ